MTATERENQPIGDEQVDIVAYASQRAHARARRNDEADELLAILEPYGLPAAVRAATAVFPAVRERRLDLGAATAPPLEAVRDALAGLIALSQFDLPENWQPGEALATSQSDALRKMLLAVVSDPRLVLVRLAEQLYRLRTAKRKPEQQRQTAIETQEIYAPLASRLGVWQLKWELEDLAFRFLEPVTYQNIARLLNEKRTEREAFIEQVKDTLEQELSRANIRAEVSGRPKHIYSIYRKMQRKDRPIEHIYDVRAIRVFVDDIAQCYAALGVVHQLWHHLPGEFDDYVANPKENDYQSLHTAVIGPGGKTLEVQIRTFEMHRHAELGVAAHWRYKEGATATSAFDQKIRYLRRMLEPSARDSDLLEQIRDDVFEDRVYAVTPKGDVVDLPAQSTPLDFAYHVHTQVGHRCRGAKVNGRIVPLTHRLENGDTVEIITGRELKPSRDWLSPQLGYLAGSRSRTKVRSWFRQQDREQNQRQGREILERELARLNAKDVSPAEIAKAVHAEDVDGLCAALGAGDVTSAAIASAVQNLRQPVQEALPKRRYVPRQAGASDHITVQGVGDLLCNFARCCRPVPPEAILGYITQNRGVSIHREDCANLGNLRNRQPNRVIDVSWGDGDNAYYAAALSISAYDRQGLLRDISNVLSDERASIESVHTQSDKKTLQANLRLELSVPDLPALSRAMARLERLPNVIAVRRHA